MKNMGGVGGGEPKSRIKCSKTNSSSYEFNGVIKLGKLFVQEKKRP